MREDLPLLASHSAHFKALLVRARCAGLAQRLARRLLEASGVKAGRQGGARKSDAGSPGKTQAKSVGFACYCTSPPANSIHDDCAGGLHSPATLPLSCLSPSRTGQSRQQPFQRMPNAIWLGICHSAAACWLWLTTTNTTPSLPSHLLPRSSVPLLTALHLLCGPT